MPNSGLPLFSLSRLEERGIKCFFGDRYMRFVSGAKVEIDKVNGLYGIWGRPDIVLQGPSSQITQACRESICHAVSSGPGASQPSSKAVDRRDILDYPLKMNSKYFKEYNENRGEFTHQLFTTPPRASTANVCSDEWWSIDICSYAFLITPPLSRSNEWYVGLLRKLDTDFLKNPHDTKILLIIRKMNKASWWKYLCNYELVDTIAVNDMFYEQNTGKGHARREVATDKALVVMYRDINTPTKINPLILLHLRLMHFSNKYILDLIKKNVVLGVDVNDAHCDMCEDYFCKGCQTRHKALPVKATHQDFSHYLPFQFVCIDGTGPLPVESLHGNFYIWAVMCLATRWVKLYFSRNKDQATIFVIFNEFLDWVVTQTKNNIENVCVTSKLLSDLGGEFRNKSMKNLCERRHIAHEFAATSMHHQNAHVERYFGTLWHGMNAVMFTGDIPPFLWEEIATHNTFIRNRVGYVTLDNMDNPFRLRFGIESRDLARCRVLYSQCWMVTDSYQPKFDAQGDELRWMGLSETIRGATVYRPRDRKVFVASMLHVYENPNECGKLVTYPSFSAYDIQDTAEYKYLLRCPYISEDPVIRQFIEILDHRSWFSEDDERTFGLVRIRTRTQSTPFWTRLATLVSSDKDYFTKAWDYFMCRDFGSDFPVFSCVNVKISDRKTKPGIVCSYHKLDKKRLEIVSEDAEVVFYPTSKIHEFQDQSILVTSLLSGNQIDVKYLNYVNPKNRSDAQKRHDWPRWKEAEDIEVAAFKDMKYLVDFRKHAPNGVFVHTTRFVYQIKIFQDGTLDKYKVRFVFRGFTQVKFRDFFETYAPVTQMTSIKLFFFFVLFYRLSHYVVDIKAAYLNAEVDTELWARLPEGFTIDGCSYARVNKAIPGLRQGAYLWFIMFTNHLKSNGFKLKEVEPCLFALFSERVTCILLIHTDNVIVGTNDKSFLDNLMTKEWSKEFVAEYAHSNSILGLQIDRIEQNAFEFSQPNYINELLEEFDDAEIKAPLVPIRENIERDFDVSLMSTSVDATIPYRRLVMKLQWLYRGSRHDIAYAVGFFSRYQNCYTEALYQELRKVVFYVRGTKNMTLVCRYDPYRPINLKFVCDASLANMADNKSTIGVIGYVQDFPFYVSSKTCKAVLTSSCETESHSIFEACKMAIYTRNWIRQFTQCVDPVFVFNDNEAAISIMSTYSNSGRSRHFSIKLRYVIGLVTKGLVKLGYVSSEENAADILTHSLGPQKFIPRRVMLCGPGGDVAVTLFSQKGGDLKSTSVRRITADELETFTSYLSSLLARVVQGD